MPCVIKSTAPLRRYKDLVINLCEMAEANLCADVPDTARIIMRSGNSYFVPRKVALSWFDDLMDFSEDISIDIARSNRALRGPRGKKGLTGKEGTVVCQL